MGTSTDRSERYSRVITHEDLIITFDFDFSVKLGISARNIEVLKDGQPAALTDVDYDKINELVEEEEAYANLFEYNDFLDDHMAWIAERSQDDSVSSCYDSSSYGGSGHGQGH